MTELTFSLEEVDQIENEVKNEFRQFLLNLLEIIETR